MVASDVGNMTQVAKTCTKKNIGIYCTAFPHLLRGQAKNQQASSQV
jgi:hypothetical protein